MKKRLNKALADAGIGARRKVEELIFAGAVTVNGEVCRLPQTRVSSSDIVCVQGNPLSISEKFYCVLNKPIGYTCSHKRMGKKALVYDLFPKELGRLFTAGRLDRMTEGLIIVTNDGDFAQRVIHPSSGLEKEYVVKTDREIVEKDLEKLRKGTVVEGVQCTPVRVTKVRKGTIKVIVREGKKHEVREIVAAAGMKVLELKRVRIGNLRLGTLPVGQWRELGENEREKLVQ